jgi:hypothetical protein
MVSNCPGETPGNILKLKRKKPILHSEKSSIINIILYARTAKIFLEKTQFFILLSAVQVKSNYFFLSQIYQKTGLE